MGQMLVEAGRPQSNLSRMRTVIEEARQHGADLVLLPELLDCGWCDESAREHARSIPGETFDTLSQAAADSGVHLCAGLSERAGENIYNSAVLISPTGDLLLKHRKVNELSIARHIYATGKSAKAICETPLGTLGLMICSDGFFPGQALTRALARAGARLILSPCAWAVAPDHDQEREPYGHLWRDVYGRVAREHGIWIAGCSNVGEIRHGAWAGHHCIGSSMLVAPGGEVRASGPYGRAAEQVVIAKVTPWP